MARHTLAASAATAALLVLFLATQAPPQHLVRQPTHAHGQPTQNPTQPTLSRMALRRELGGLFVSLCRGRRKFISDGAPLLLDPNVSEAARLDAQPCLRQGRGQMGTAWSMRSWTPLR